MHAKLTLSLDQNVIERAKRYAQRRHRSLSGLVESYLREVTRTDLAADEVTPVVAELSGVVPGAAADVHRDDYADYLAEKYR